MSDKTRDKSDLHEAACFYHSYPQPGKLEIAATKPLGNQRDLALAYSPGVAAPCEEIAEDPGKAFDYTARGNLVAVISNGTAVLGLGAIGPLASKPVMEGKAVLFKKFAGIDVFDIEVDETDIDRFVDVVAALEPTFGGVNLEDIKGPECFEIEAELRERMGIPVFHDDQHGTAIIAGPLSSMVCPIRARPLKRSRLLHPVPGRRLLPASICWSRLVPDARISGSPTLTGLSMRAGSRWTGGKGCSRRRPSCARLMM